MCKILVIDDDSASLTLVTLVLLRAGHHVYSANNADDGYALARQLRPHIILLNDGMPHMSGGELCLKIKLNEETAATPVILISAGTRVDDPKYIEASRADGVLRKPYMPGDLLHVVSAHTETGAFS